MSEPTSERAAAGTDARVLVAGNLAQRIKSASCRAPKAVIEIYAMSQTNHNRSTEAASAAETGQVELMPTRTSFEGNDLL